uniref:Putative secreted protein n=1 Tax=Anopheles marajoara TaxID=58244 RepID=A0A2M4CC97_9DIPT
MAQLRYLMIASAPLVLPLPQPLLLLPWSELPAPLPPLPPPIDSFPLSVALQQPEPHPVGSVFESNHSLRYRRINRWA